MGYDLFPKNKKLERFHFGAFSFPILLEACGYLFPCIHNKFSWHCVFGIDDRFPLGDKYPAILSNDGFEVTEEEAKIMARMARNFVAIQEGLKNEIDPSLVYHNDFQPKNMWPQKIRDDFVAKFREFADWAEQSGGFKIY